MAAVIGISVHPKDKTYTCDVPVNSLEEDGVPPEVGDSVDYSVKGTVQSVDGGQATVKIDSINGEPVGEEAAESPEEEAGEEGQEGAGENPGLSGANPGPGGANPGVALPAVPGLGLLRRGAGRIWLAWRRCASGSGDLGRCRERRFKAPCK
jgi:hypothetical protein